jgi:hypothetical protein
MRPKERRESGQTDLSGGGSTRSSTWATRWRSSVEPSTGGFSRSGSQRPIRTKRVIRRPTLLMAGLSILKAMHDLSDEALCERWVENLYFQLFCAEEFFQHKTPSSRRCSSRLRTSTSRRTPTLDVRSSPRTPNRPLLHGRLISVSAYHEATAGSFRSPPPICRSE